MAKFCNYCGIELIPGEDDIIEEDDMIMCPNCGAAYRDGKSAGAEKHGC